MRTVPVIIWGVVATLGVVLLVAGVVINLVGDDIVESIIHEKLDLFNEDSDGYKYFIKPPVPVKVNFTFFEVKNPENISKGAKPILEERGPYVYIEHREKRNLTWYDKHDNEELNSSSMTGRQFVKFGQYKYYTFDEELSCDGCKEDDEVTIANMPLLGLIGKLFRMFMGSEKYSATGPFREIKKGAENNFTGYGFDGIFFKQKVNDFIFGGLGVKTGTAGWMASNVTYITDRLPMTAFDYETGFALFNHRNDTMENEWYEVETEQESWDRHTMITKWGQKNSANPKSEDNLMPDLYDAKTDGLKTGSKKNWWGYLADVDGVKYGSNTCNILKGTDGSQFPPYVKKEDNLWIYNSAPCRSIYLVYNQEVEVEGIPTLEYSVPLDGANVNNSLNTCACESLSNYLYGKTPHPINNETSCVRRSSESPGTLDLSSCDETVTAGCYDGIQDLYYCQGAAVTLSYPHFYLAEDQTDHFDPDSLKPTAEKHALKLHVEPYTGMALKMHSRIQLNVPLISSETLKTPNGNLNLGGLSLVEGMPDIPNFPVVWIDLGADVESDPDLVDKLNSELVMPLNILNIGQWVAIGVGVALIVVAGFFSLIGPFKCRSDPTYI